MKKPVTNIITAGPNAVRVTQVDRRAKPLPEPERRARILRGLQRLTDEARQLGRDGAAQRAQVLIAEATRIVAQLCDVESAIAEPRKNHVGLAADAAGKLLMRQLPGCFDSVQEASGWAAAHLPLSAARRQAGQDELEKTRLGQQRHTLRQSFWRATEQAALLVAARCSGTFDAGLCLDECERVGRFV